MTIGWWPELEAEFNLSLPLVLGFQGKPVNAAEFSISLPLALSMVAQGVSQADFNLSLPIDLAIASPYQASFDLNLPLELGMTASPVESATFDLSLPLNLGIDASAGENPEAAFGLSVPVNLAMAAILFTPTSYENTPLGTYITLPEGWSGINIGPVIGAGGPGGPGNYSHDGSWYRNSTGGGGGSRIPRQYVPRSALPNVTKMLLIRGTSTVPGWGDGTASEIRFYNDSNQLLGAAIANGGQRGRVGAYDNSGDPNAALGGTYQFTGLLASLGLTGFAGSNSTRYSQKPSGANGAPAAGGPSGYMNADKSSIGAPAAGGDSKQANGAALATGGSAGGYGGNGGNADPLLGGGAGGGGGASYSSGGGYYGGRGGDFGGGGGGSGPSQHNAYTYQQYPGGQGYVKAEVV